MGSGSRLTATAARWQRVAHAHEELTALAEAFPFCSPEQGEGRAQEILDAAQALVNAANVSAGSRMSFSGQVPGDGTEGGSTSKGTRSPESVGGNRNALEPGPGEAPGARQAHSEDG